MNWWSASKHFILPDSMTKVRSKVLAMMIQDLDPEEMSKETMSSVLAKVSERD